MGAPDHPNFTYVLVEVQRAAVQTVKARCPEGAKTPVSSVSIACAMFAVSRSRMLLRVRRAGPGQTRDPWLDRDSGSSTSLPYSR